MKKYLIIASAALLMSACNQSNTDTAIRESDSLRLIVNEREASLNEFIASFNDVERNLDSVAVKQHLISMSADRRGELKLNQKERINNEIAAINSLMDENRKKLAALNSKLKRSGNKNAELEKTIATINRQIVQKDLELADLNAKLNDLNAQVAQLRTVVDTLNIQNGIQSQSIADKTMALHTAYYIIGKSNDLKEAKIIDRKGGLLGIGRTSKLNSDFDNSKFTRIDYTQVSTIAINSDMKIISNHPTSSYTLDKDLKDKDLVKNIVITNPEIFWSASKYLVIVKD
jgi:uncharacterized coiled-coil protein SlyX